MRIALLLIAACLFLLVCYMQSFVFDHACPPGQTAVYYIDNGGRAGSIIHEGITCEVK